MVMERLRVLVADKHGLVREGICALLQTCQDIEVVGEATNGQEALEALAREEPDVMLADVTLPVIDGASLARRLRSENKKTRVLLLGESADRECIIRGIKAGGDGYILKGATARELLSAIMTVHRGGYFLYPSVAKKVVEEYLSVEKGAAGTNAYDRLSDREKEVLRLVAEGRRRQQIARILDLSPETVQRQRANLMKKLSVHSQADLVKYALRNGIINIEDGI
ncbi:MAG: DNA-binding response regulator [Dehalococcoidia bacterium]|nr:MAG: DNA-binding response regulator [Dehalococcoidia bacterium]